MRYRITTREVLHKLLFSDSEINAVTKVTSRLTKHGYLNRHELYAPRNYFVLGTKSAAFLGISQKRTKALGAQVVIEALEKIRDQGLKPIDPPSVESSYFSFPTKQHVHDFRKRGRKLL